MSSDNASVSLFDQDGWILAKLFSCVFMNRDEVEVHKLSEKERDQYPAILTEQTWSIIHLCYIARLSLNKMSTVIG